jgi:hypothetical protein
MGYEVIYSYHERGEDGDYNRDEEQKLHRPVGNPYEDVSLERLASAVMAQMARRDIWVTDVEVFEFARKPINFRETKGGIILKNKKFMLDSANIASSIVAVPDAPANNAPHQAVAQQGQASAGDQPHNSGPRRPIAIVVFAPELHNMPELNKKGVKFTMDKKYPVYSKEPHPTGIGEVYKMVDDAGREQLISDKYFVPGDTELFGDKQLGFSETPEQRDGGNLYWGGANSDIDMPNVR